MPRTTLLALSVAVLLAGCVLPGTTAVPSPYPASYLPTVIHLTAESIDSATMAVQPATMTPTETPTLLPATLAPSPTATAGPGIPLAAIQIRAPGPMSKIVSPLQVQMLAVAGDSKRIDVSLFGEDGRLLNRELTPVVGSPEGDPLSLKIRFEIRAAGETGYLQVSTKDLRGRIESLVTVPILLLSSGVSQINPAGNTIYERVALSDLPPDAEASGGVLPVEGQFMPFNRQPMILELISADGQSLVTRLLDVSGSDWQPFSTTLPFKVDKPTAARLFMHQADEMLGGEAYIYSQPITLNP